MYRLFTTLFLLSFASSAFASAFDSTAKYAYLLDYDTNAVLYSKNANEQMVPSSMTKLMTTYILFDLIKKGVYKPTDTFRVSETAWRMQGSKMFVGVGTDVTIDDLLHGIIVQSGNDACTVVAENISGSEEKFAELMNKKAQELGLKNSHFMNSTGWPDPTHRTTAHDLAVLSQRLISDFPEYYRYFAIPDYTYNKIKQPNRNLLLWRNIGADGLKTGHTEEAGYGITASAVQNGHRLIAVINGLKSEKQRADEAQRILEYGFHYFDHVPLFKKGDTVGEASVWFGDKDTVTLTPAKDLAITLPKLAEKDKMRLSVVYKGPVPAPVEKDKEIASLKVEVPGMEPQFYPLYAATPVEKAGFFRHIWLAVKQYLG